MLKCKGCNKDFVPDYVDQLYCNQQCRQRKNWRERKKRNDHRGGYNRVTYIRLWLQAAGVELPEVPCHYCGSHVSIDDFVIDHKVPRSLLKDRQAKQEISNLVVSCKRCNAWKSDTDYDEFKDFIKVYLENRSK